MVVALDIDTEIWAIERFTVSKSEAYRKDRQVDWHVENGQSYGDVHDTGKLLIEPLFSVKVWLRRKTKEIRAKLAVEDIKKDLEKFAPKYPKIRYRKLTEGLLYEIELPDNHIGKLTWGEESGSDSDLKIQTKLVIDTLEKLLSYAKNFPVERILLPIGNDWFNTDNKADTTTAGTLQQEDTRWKKTYRAGRVLAVQMIDMCAAVAPVDVLVIAGNHDEQKTFYLGDALVCWYHGNPNVTINNSARDRKYYAFGNALIGFTHGSEEKLNRLANIMAGEVPQMWAKSKYREWHTGHLHHKEDILYKTHEDDGVVVRMLRSLTPTDAWHYKKGFVGAVQASESFLWSKDNGVIAQFTVSA